MNKLVQVLFQSLLSVALLPGMIRAPQESEKVIIINLARPGEGETFYAGPSSLLYNIPIHGWVESELYDSEEIKIVLAIYQNSKLVSTQETYLDENGEYAFYATVNPEGSTENFPATEADCASYCHYLSELVLPAGQMTLELTAVDPVGNQDRLERQIFVDRSDYVHIPLEINIEATNSTDHSLENIPITASTWIYMWRSRHFAESTNNLGHANIRVEALAESPTQYWLRVEPSIVDGKLYFSDEPVEVILPPGATSAPPVSLNVKISVGRINGKVTGIDEPLVSSARVLAIRPTDGVYFSEELSSQGEFTFDDIPLHEYIVVPVISGQQAGYDTQAETVDLMKSHTASIDFTITDVRGHVLQGVVKGEENQPLPFAWITNEDLPITQRVMTDTGGFEVHGLPSESMTFIVNAPGYYSRAYTLKPASDQSQILSPVLVRQPDAKSISWGSGEIIAPAESMVEAGENHVVFRGGWLWGYNQQTTEITIRHNSGEIVLTDGRFAFESLPNRTSWLYIIEGKATIHPENDLPSVTVNAGEMVSMTPDGSPIPISIDRAVVMALHSGMDGSLASVWEPTLNARIRDHLARIGVNSVQIITFITYGLILTSFVVFPFVALYLKLKRRKKPMNEENDETR